MFADLVGSKAEEADRGWFTDSLLSPGEDLKFYPQCRQEPVQASFPPLRPHRGVYGPVAFQEAPGLAVWSNC